MGGDGVAVKCGLGGIGGGLVRAMYTGPYLCAGVREDGPRGKAGAAR